MSKPTDQPGRDLWAEYLRRRQPTAPALEPKYPDPPAVHGGPDLTGEPTLDELDAADRVMAKWPLEQQDPAVALRWVRGWRP
jgi:hypothetical protein